MENCGYILKREEKYLKKGVKNYKILMKKLENYSDKW